MVSFENVKDAAAKAALDEKKETVYNAQVEAWVEEAKPEEFFEHPTTERAKQFLNVFTFEHVEK